MNEELIKQQEESDTTVETTTDESKGILQGGNYIEKLAELEAMLDASPRRFKRKYQNKDNSFSARFKRHAQTSFK